MFFTAQVNLAISSASRNDLGCLKSTVSLTSGRNPWTKYRIFSASVMFNRRNLFVKSVRYVSKGSIAPCWRVVTACQIIQLWLSFANLSLKESLSSTYVDFRSIGRE